VHLHILCKHKLLFWMELIAINRLKALLRCMFCAVPHNIAIKIDWSICNPIICENASKKISQRYTDLGMSRTYVNCSQEPNLLMYLKKKKNCIDLKQKKLNKREITYQHHISPPSVLVVPPPLHSKAPFSHSPEDNPNTWVRKIFTFTYQVPVGINIF